MMTQQELADIKRKCYEAMREASWASRRFTHVWFTGGLSDPRMNPHGFLSASGSFKQALRFGSKSRRS